MASTDRLLTDAQFKALEEEKQRLISQQKLLKSDNMALDAELTKLSGAPLDGVDLALHERLVALNAELTGLRFDELEFALQSAEGGVTVTRWTARVTAQPPDDWLRVSYVTTKDERSRVACDQVTPLEWSADLAPLVELAGVSLRRLLFGLYDLSRLRAERLAALPAGVRPRAGGAVRLPRPDGGALSWCIEFQPAEERFQHVFSITDGHGVESSLYPELLFLVRERSVTSVLAELLAPAEESASD